MTTPKRQHLSFLLLGLSCFFLVAFTSDPLNNYPWMLEGPGLTLDESFNVQQGVYLVEVAKQLGPFALFPENVGSVFNTENGFLPDHPPLGRWWLGLWHHATWMLWTSEKPETTQIVIACGRVGSAAAFGLLVAIIGIFTTRWFGFTAGLLAALSYACMPRVFGHAHIASLETFLNLTYFLAVAVIVDQWKDKAPSWKIALWTGLFMGLAMLTKIQGFFIPIPVILWALTRYRAASIQPLLIWGVTAWAVFFIGWPWLWLDPIGHTLEFLGSSTDRATLNVYYLGQIFTDKAAPWHYPWITTAVALPLLTLFASLFTIGSTAKNRFADARLTLLTASAIFPLIVFSLPVAKYDAERLFLIAYPFWAILAGLGFATLIQRLQWQTPTIRTAIIATLLILTNTYAAISPRGSFASLNLLGQPFSRSFEEDYWGFNLTSSRLNQILASEHVNHDPASFAITPELHQFQILDLNEQQGNLLKPIKFISLNDLKSNPALINTLDGLITFHRKANPPDYQQLSEWFDMTSSDPDPVPYFYPTK